MGFIYYQLYPFITKNKYNGINSLQFASHSEHLHHLIPGWLIALMAMRRLFSLSKGRLVSLLRVALCADATFARPNSDLHQRNLTPAFSLSALSTR